MGDYKTDLEIARGSKKLPISKIASDVLSIDESNLVPYGPVSYTHLTLPTKA